MWSLPNQIRLFGLSASPGVIEPLICPDLTTYGSTDFINTQKTTFSYLSGVIPWRVRSIGNSPLLLKKNVHEVAT